MPIDSSIYFQQKQPDFMGSYEDGLKIKDLVRQDKAAQRTEAFQNQLKQSFNVDPKTGETTLDATKAKDLFAIDPMEAGKVVAQNRQQQAERFQNQLKVHDQIWGGVNDDASFQAAKKASQKFEHYDEHEMPAAWGPEAQSWIKSNLGMSQGYAERLKTGTEKQMADAKTAEAAAATSKADTEAKGLPIRQKEVDAKVDENRIRRQELSNSRTDKQFMAMKDDLDPNKARGGNLAKSQAMINNADRVGALFQQFPDYNIPPQQTAELSSALAGLINGGSAQSQHQIDSLTPSSMRGDAQKIANWVTGNPSGAGQQAMMKMMHETANREREVAVGQVKQAQIQRLAAYQHLKAKDGPGFQNMLDSYGITAEDLAKYGPQGRMGAGTPLPAPGAPGPVRTAQGGPAPAYHELSDAELAALYNQRMGKGGAASANAR